MMRRECSLGSTIAMAVLVLVLLFSGQTGQARNQIPLDPAPGNTSSTHPTGDEASRCRQEMKVTMEALTAYFTTYYPNASGLTDKPLESCVQVGALTRLPCCPLLGTYSLRQRDQAIAIRCEIHGLGPVVAHLEGTSLKPPKPGRETFEFRPPGPPPTSPLRLGDDFPTLLRKADAGDVEAMVLVGNLYRFGQRGAPSNWDKAMEYLEKAAQAGSVNGMINLGLRLYWDQGKKREGLKWLEAAGLKGSATACYTRASLEPQPETGSPAELARNRMVRLQWLNRAATLGDVQAMFKLSQLLAELHRKPREAWNWLRRAAEAGYADAMFAYARSLFRRKKQDNPEETWAWLQLAIRRSPSSYLRYEWELFRNVNRDAFPPEVRKAGEERLEQLDRDVPHFKSQW